MVSTMVNVSAFIGEPPANGGSRKIPGGPLYEPSKIKAILAKGETATSAWTRKCAVEVQNLCLDGNDICKLLNDAITSGRYRDSEWCVQKPTGPWAACDAYELVRYEWNRFSHKELPVEYFVKFAIGKTGQILLLVSCHL